VEAEVLVAAEAEVVAAMAVTATAATTTEGRKRSQTMVVVVQGMILIFPRKRKMRTTVIAVAAMMTMIATSVAAMMMIVIVAVGMTPTTRTGVAEKTMTEIDAEVGGTMLIATSETGTMIETVVAATMIVTMVSGAMTTVMIGGAVTIEIAMMAGGAEIILTAMTTDAEVEAVEIRSLNRKRLQSLQLQLRWIFLALMILRRNPPKHRPRLQHRAGVLLSLLPRMVEQPASVILWELLSRRLLLVAICSVAQPFSLLPLLLRCNRCQAWVATKQHHNQQRQCLPVVS
jgi:hypothetical protein